MEDEIRLSSNEIIQEYGKSLSGKEVIEKAENDEVPEEDVILISTRHSLEITDPNLAVDPKDLLDFYDAERLKHMQEEQTLTKEFANVYNENLVSTLSDEEKDDLYKEIISDTATIVNNTPIEEIDMPTDLAEDSIQEETEEPVQKETTFEEPQEQIQEETVPEESQEQTQDKITPIDSQEQVQETLNIPEENVPEIPSEESQEQTVAQKSLDGPIQDTATIEEPVKESQEQPITEPITQEPIQEQSELAVEPIKRTYFEELVFNYYMIGILPANYTGSSLDFSFIKHKFETDQITYGVLVDLYINEIITSKQFIELLEVKNISTQTIFTGDILTEEELKIISSEKRGEMFSEAIEEQKLSLDELMYLYLDENAIRVTDLRNALIKGHITESLSSYLNEKTDLQKVEELYVNYLIDYNCLVALKREHIISEEQFDELKYKISSEQFYKDLSETKDLYIHTTPDNISSSIEHFYRAGQEEKQDFKQEQEMLHNLYGVDGSYEDFTLIHATDLDGNPTSLDGYTCLPMPRFNVVTLKKFHSDSDTFIMPYQQAAFFLHNSYEPAGFNDYGSQSELDITNRQESETGYGAEILLPFEDYNDTEAISVVAAGLNYTRQLFDTIYELTDSEDARNQLKQNGSPTPTAEQYLKETKIERMQERDENY